MRRHCNNLMVFRLVTLLILIVACCKGAKALVETANLSSFPRIIYGTAWKEDRTADLVYDAVMSGFRHIDTACQPKHYNERLVGEGWTRAAQELGLSRDSLWLQTKYTSLDGQDPERLPYEEDASLEDRVRQSVARSLENLQTDYLDSLVIHGPEDNWEDMFTVWRVFEEMVDKGKVRALGISNFYQADAVEHLYDNVRIKPSVVQNRFYDDSDIAYDILTRAFCLEKGIEYQSFWTLGANRHGLQHERIMEMAAQKGLSVENIMYAFVVALGITPLDGTTNKQHMQEDLELLSRIKGGERILSEEEIDLFSEILGIPDAGADEL